jgi:hypothetical protein
MAGKTGNEEEVATYEQELADYLQQRIKPGLNSGAIPLLARSIANDIAHRERPNGASGDTGADDEPGAAADDEPTAEAEDEPTAQADDEPSDQADDEPSSDGEASDFEADMHEFQAELGEDWILRFSVQGGAAWLTAEKEDGSQRVEAPTASVISEAVELLKEGGGRGT